MESATLTVNVRNGRRRPGRPLDHATTRSARQAATGEVRPIGARTHLPSLLKILMFPRACLPCAYRIQQFGRRAAPYAPRSWRMPRSRRVGGTGGRLPRSRRREGRREAGGRAMGDCDAVRSALSPPARGRRRANLHALHALCEVLLGAVVEDFDDVHRAREPPHPRVRASRRPPRARGQTHTGGGGRADEESGRVTYYNTRTGKVSRTKPKESDGAAPSKEPRDDEPDATGNDAFIRRLRTKFKVLTGLFQILNQVWFSSSLQLVLLSSLLG